MGLVRTYIGVNLSSSATGWTFTDMHIVSNNLVPFNNQLVAPNAITLGGTVTFNQGNLANAQGVIGMSSSGGVVVANNLNVWSMQNLGVRVGGAAVGVGRMIVNGTLNSSNHSNNGLDIKCSCEINSLVASDNANVGLNVSGTLGPVLIKSATINNNTSYAIQFAGASTNIKVFNLSTTGNNTGGSVINTTSLSAGGEVVFRNWSHAESNLTGIAPSVYNNWILRSHTEQGTSGNHITRVDGGTIQSDTTGYHGASGLGWQIIPTDSKRDANYPITLPVARIACNSGSTVTLTAWVKISDNAKVNSRLRIIGNSINGVTSDVITTTNAGTTYTQYQIQCTPTETGVVEVFFEAWRIATNTTDYAEISDLAISQT